MGSVDLNEHLEKEELAEGINSGVESSSRSQRLKSVIVIGGGVSGLVAATTLIKAGGFSVTLLEADDHIGGRVNTQKFGDSYVEFGAEWVHGEKDNRVFEVMEPHGVLVNETDDPSHSAAGFDELVFVTQNGEVMNTYFNKRVGEIFEAIQAKRYGDEDEQNNAMKSDSQFESLGAYAAKVFEDMNEKSPVHGKESMSQAALDFIHRYVNILDSADSWLQTSNSNDGDQFEYCEGNHLVSWNPPATYSSLLRVILDQSPKETSEIKLPDWIKLGAEVVEIIYSTTDDSLATVSCRDGGIFKADHVLTTVSLGVLKERHSTLFIPNLPSKKQTAIQSLGFGTANKIYLEFEHSWWKVDNEEFLGLGFLWEGEENEVKNANWLAESSDTELLAEFDGIPVWCRSLIGFNALFSQCDNPKPILQGWMSGVSSRFMETLDMDYITKSCSKVLNKFLSKQFGDIPEPINSARSAWSTNPFTRGSYSFRTVESEKLDVWAKDIAEPILNQNNIPILTFAGEATHSTYFSTVHGAYDTGVREAKRILEFYGKNLD